MYHPQKYTAHNEALGRFCHAFNTMAATQAQPVSMEPSAYENFRDDGKITHHLSGKVILYDFEKRNSYYNCCGFPFKEFGQFERKIDKPEILLSIQSCRDEQCFCIAWHEDFKKEEIRYIGSATGSGRKEHSGKRFTLKFRELRYSEMDIFYEILLRAFAYDRYNALSFGP
jgi:hypothetical protein